MGVSIAGLITGIIIIIVLVAINVTASSYCTYSYNGVCYD